MDEDILAKALAGDDLAVERLAVYAEGRLRPFAGALVERSLGPGNSSAAEDILEKTLVEIPFVLDGRPETLDRFIGGLVWHLIFKISVAKRQREVRDRAGMGERLRVVWGEELG